MVRIYQAHCAGVAVAVDPVRAVVGVKVLAPVLVETASPRHGRNADQAVVDSAGFGVR
jgi:hypothetical protein